MRQVIKLEPRCTHVICPQPQGDKLNLIIIFLYSNKTNKSELTQLFRTEIYLSLGWLEFCGTPALCAKRASIVNR